MRELPIVCSLAAGELEERLAAISSLGTDALIARDRDGSRQRLRFRADAEVRRRLEAIVAAEAQCCAFIDLTLREENGELILQVAAPAGAEQVAEGLAAAFGRGSA